jgi:hypothetical protein
MKVEGVVFSCTCRSGADDGHLVVQMKVWLRVALCHVWPRGGKQEKLEETCGGEVALMFAACCGWTEIGASGAKGGGGAPAGGQARHRVSGADVLFFLFVVVEVRLTQGSGDHHYLH